jgi:tetratricopeptide (TPR) repeat protein
MSAPRNDRARDHIGAALSIIDAADPWLRYGYLDEVDGHHAEAARTLTAAGLEAEAGAVFDMAVLRARPDPEAESRLEAAASDLHPDLGAEALAYLGLTAYARLDFDSARDRLYEALDHPGQTDPASVQRYLALMAAEGGDHEGAVALAESALKMASRHSRSQLWSEHALLLRDMGLWERAHDAWRQALDTAEGDGCDRVLLARAHAYRLADDLDMAAEDVWELLDRPGPVQPPYLAAALSIQGVAHRARGRNDEAEECFVRALDTARGILRASIQMDRAHARERTGREGEASGLLDEADWILQDGRVPWTRWDEALMMRASLLAWRGTGAEAAELLESRLDEVRPLVRPVVYARIGRHLVMVRRGSDALPWLERALSSPSRANPARVRADIARAHAARENWHEAVRVATACLSDAVGPTRVHVLHTLVWGLMQLKMDGAARRRGRELMADPFLYGEEWTLDQLGLAMARLRDWESIRQLFGPWLEHDGSQGRIARWRWADMLYFRGELNEARARYDALLAECDPVPGHLALCAANCAVAQHDYDAALDLLDKAIESDREDVLATAWFNLGGLHEHAERWEKAYDAYGWAAVHAEREGNRRLMNKARRRAELARQWMTPGAHGYPEEED